MSRACCRRSGIGHEHAERHERTDRDVLVVHEILLGQRQALHDRVRLGDIAGVQQEDHAAPMPVLPLAIFLPVIIGAPVLLLSKRVAQVLDAMPVTWLIALQLYRVVGAMWLVGALRGTLPGVFGWPAGIGDVLTGLFAVPAAIAVATGTAQGRRAAIAWNILGLADFAVAITLGAITSPGPFQLIVPDVPSIGAGAYPGVLTPAFVVPSSILLHALSLRQLRRRNTA